MHSVAPAIEIEKDDFEAVCQQASELMQGLTGTFKVNTNKYEKVFDPADFNLPLTKDYDLFGGRTPQEAAQIFDSVLENRSTEGQKNTVLANAAIAIQCMDQRLDVLQALDIARESLESGKALANFKKFVELNS